MSKFKVGDKVRCVDAVCTSGDLAFGTVYTVSGVSGLHNWDNNIYVEGVALSYRDSRFELVEEPKVTPVPHQWLVHDARDGETYTYDNREEAENEARNYCSGTYPVRIYKLVSETKVTLEDVA